ncbi:hypothetical protein [Amycolatopsis sp. Hca4]|uniref:hypothetical protein n=1 Tax=Amycolatopsis sp. Hca4 TaxID=2742131 RepID=UPI00158FB380|nr:hypothetical protein [Amycolatopsis sp. Hca4]QKV73792.1 hypothetical protein HUT10_08420 [Amycolatopsis sp. Hca4]
MLILCILYGVAALLGIAWPLAALVADARIRPERLPTVDLEPEPRLLGMLGGGPGRLVDATVMDLVDRSIVTARGGALTATGTGTGDLDLTSASVLGVVEEAGGEGIAEVRRRAGRRVLNFGSAYGHLADRGLVVRRMRRQWEPLGRALAVLAPLALVTYMMMAAGQFGTSAYRTSVGLALAGWVVFPVLTWCLGKCRRGYRGSDPRTALGSAYLRAADTDTPARQVAVHGFAGLADQELAASIKGDSQDSAWESLPDRKHAYGIDDIAWSLFHPAAGDYALGT